MKIRFYTLDTKAWEFTGEEVVVIKRSLCGCIDGTFHPDGYIDINYNNAPYCIVDEGNGLCRAHATKAAYESSLEYVYHSKEPIMVWLKDKSVLSGRA